MFIFDDDNWNVCLIKIWCWNTISMEYNCFKCVLVDTPYQSPDQFRLVFQAHGIMGGYAILVI